MRVLLDTNVLVSAFATRGLCADLFELVLLEHELVLGHMVLQELDKALRTKLKLPGAQAKAILGLVSDEATQTVVEAAPARARATPADTRVLGEALAGSAELFITGDAALLEIKAIGAMEIVSPRGFWEKMKRP